MSLTLSRLSTGLYSAQPPLVGARVDEHHRHRSHRVEQHFFQRNLAADGRQAQRYGLAPATLGAARKPQRQMSEQKIEDDAEADDRGDGQAESALRRLPSAGRGEDVEERPQIENRDAPHDEAGEVGQTSGRVEPQRPRRRWRRGR